LLAWAEGTVAGSDSHSLGDVAQKGVDGGNDLTVSANQTYEEFHSVTTFLKCAGIAQSVSVAYPGIFFFGGGFNKFG
jgi:hypothetical protein